jgi:hypothetical protein
MSSLYLIYFFYNSLAILEIASGIQIVLLCYCLSININVLEDFLEISMIYFCFVAWYKCNQYQFLSSISCYAFG